MLRLVKPIYLKAAREKAGLTQDELEALSSVRQGMISKLERNADARPAFQTVAKLAAALHVDPRALRFGREASA